MHLGMKIVKLLTFYSWALWGKNMYLRKQLVTIIGYKTSLIIFTVCSDGIGDH